MDGAQLSSSTVGSACELGDDVLLQSMFVWHIFKVTMCIILSSLSNIVTTLHRVLRLEIVVTVSEFRL